MSDTGRITEHPILTIPERRKFKFWFDDRECEAREGEVISSSLFANGITLFGHHHEDGSPQGIFCANGQCSQCLVIAGGLAVKSCMEQIKPGQRIYSCNALPELPKDDTYDPRFRDAKTLKCDVLVVGGGPSGVAAAVELGELGHSVILVDDKDCLGGKLVLQTHKFFGSIEDCRAGTRGIEIARLLKDEVEKLDNVKIFLDSTALGVFVDKKIGIIQYGKYFLVEPKKLLVAAGAREKALGFPGWDLPGVYGAGAFQTLLNRDLVKPSSRLFVIGGGNVGLIAAYHALQGGITVVGLAEAMPQVGGYKVHQDKILRLGVPVYLSHTVISAEGDDSGVKSITIGQVDEKFNRIPGTEKTFLVDTILIAVGLTPISEIYDFARKIGMDVYAAGDAQEIAEASAAMFGGKIAGLEIARDLGDNVNIPVEWSEKADVLKSKPGKITSMKYPTEREGIFPVFHCAQEIPCNPCASVCPRNSIAIEGDSLLGLPEFKGKCTGCARCVAICPGLAITLVDFRKAREGYANVTVPFELLPENVARTFRSVNQIAGDVARTFRSVEGNTVPALDMEGRRLAEVKIVKITAPKFAGSALLVTLEVPADVASRVAGIRVQKEEETQPLGAQASRPRNDTYIACRCERVTDARIREKIRAGVRDMNQLKAELNAGMGACGGKTCQQLIERIFREEGVELSAVTQMTYRPMCMEVPLGVFAGVK